MIAVGASDVVMGDEAMPRHLEHRREHRAVADATPGELLLDHAAPGRGSRGQVRPVRCLRHFSSFHSASSPSARSSVKSSTIGVIEIQPSLTSWKSVPGRGSHTGSSPPIQ